MAFAQVWLGPPPHSKASGITLSTNKIIELRVFVFSYLQLESGEAKKTAVAAAAAASVALFQVGGIDHVLPHLLLPF